MMDYEMFKAVVKEKFLSYMPEEYRDAEIQVHPVRKVNRTLDGLTVLPKGNAQIRPTFYVNEMYGHYQACGDLEAVLKNAAGQYAQTAEIVKDQKPEEVIDARMEHFKENVIMCLINTEQNRELLADMPSRKFHDLSVIYRWVVETAPGAVKSIIVTDRLAKMAGMTEEELFQCAVENTRRISPVSVRRMSDIVGGVPDMDGLELPPEIREKMEEANRTAENMWIIGNASGIYGAVSMLYEENLHQLAEKLGDNLFILPSSVHEVIAIPAEIEGKNMEGLLGMVHEVNMEKLELEERLSNSVYHYDRNARKVTLAAESPEKRLDGKMAEMPLIEDENRKR